MPHKIIIFCLAAVLVLPFTYSAQDNDHSPSLEEKIGHMLLMGFRGTELTKDHPFVRVLQNIPLGGVVLFDYDVPSATFPRNIINPCQTRKLILSLQKYSCTPLLVAVDAEGGRVNRLKPKYGFQEVPSAAKAGKMKDSDIREVYLRLAEQLAGLGINMNLAPVVDINLNPDNPVIGALDRAFAGDPETVTKCAGTFISAHHKFSVLTAIKHFPGHGSSREDSHKGMTDITETYQPQESIPFKNIISAGSADAVMTAHVVNRNVDPNHPATLSSRCIKEILRNKWGYNGVVISDDLHMGAVLNHYSFSEAVVKAVEAGCDLLAVSNNGRLYDGKAAYKARDALLKAVREGHISEERINFSYQRIMQMKKKAGLAAPKQQN